MKKLKCVFLILLPLIFASCASTSLSNLEAHPEFYGDDAPVSILVMPPINNSTNVDAKDFFYYTLNQNLCDDGYYVFPPLLAMQTLQQESAYDSELFYGKDISKFGTLFGADLLLFTTISEWEKNAFAKEVVVEIEYDLWSTKTSQSVFRRKGNFTYSTDTETSSSGLLALLVQQAVSMIETGLTDYVSVARACNYNVFKGTLPAGKYSPLHKKDAESTSYGNGEFVKIKSTSLNY